MASVDRVILTEAPPELQSILAAIDSAGQAAAWKQRIDGISKRSLLVHLGVVLALWLLWLLIDTPGVFLIAAGCVYFPGAVFMAVNESRASPVLITPLSWWFGWHALSLGIAPIWLGYRWMNLSSVNYVAMQVSVADIAQGFVYYATGVLAMHFGLQRGRDRRMPPARSPDGGSLGVLLFLWVAGIFIAFAGSRLIAFNALIGPLQMGALSAACSLAISPPRLVPRGSPVYWGAVAISTFGCILAAAVVGLKFMMMISTLPLLWILLIDKRYRAFLAILLPLAAVSYLYVVEPIVDGLRGMTRTAAIGDSLIEDAQRGTLGEVAAVDQNSVVERIDDAAARIFSGIYLAYLVQDVRSSGYRFGTTMDYMLYAFIPRVLWPEKPAVSRGAWLTVELGGAESVETAESASALTAEGELYWNFGVPGEIAGMILIGWLFGYFLWRQSAPDPRQDPIRMLALLTTVFLLAGETESGTLAVAIAIQAIYFWGLRKTYDSFVSAG